MSNYFDDLDIKRLEGNSISEVDDYTSFKIIIVGNSGVGKSSLLKRAVQNKFTDTYQATIGFEFLLMYYDVNGVKIKLQIWDTCGQEMYRSLIQGFYRNTSSTILLYAINDERSFKDIPNWVNDIRKNTDNDQPIFLVGSKNDLGEELRKIEIEHGKGVKEEYQLSSFSECSAKTGYKVDDIFKNVVGLLYKKKNLGKKQLKNEPFGNKLEVDGGLIKKKKKCC